MVIGIGIDIVDVARFEKWQEYSKDKLLKLFSENELELAPQKSDLRLAQYLASRFAVKEAFFKALSNSLVRLNLAKNTFTLQFAINNIEVVYGEWGVPILNVDWKVFEERVGCLFSHGLDVQISISHEKQNAVSMVIISKD